MKTRLCSVLAASLLAALSSVACAATAKHKINASPILAGPPEELYGIGTPRARVIAVLGAPSHALSADLWVYFNFRSDDPSVNPALDTLVIAFAEDKVSGLKLAESHVLRRIIEERQSAKSKAKGTNLARH